MMYFQIFVSTGSGEAEVHIADEFYDQSAMWQVDVLGDIIHPLAERLEEAHKEMTDEWERIRKENASSTKGKEAKAQQTP